MIIDANKELLIDLVFGTSPNYDLFKNEKVKGFGEFNGSYGRWSWSKSELETLNEEQLFELYNLCKGSWK